MDHIEPRIMTEEGKVEERESESERDGQREDQRARNSGRERERRMGRGTEQITVNKRHESDGRGR